MLRARSSRPGTGDFSDDEARSERRPTSMSCASPTTIHGSSPDRNTLAGWHTDHDDRRLGDGSMRPMSRIAVGTALGLGGLLGAGWLGLQVPPSPYPSPSAGGNSLGTAALPADLPPPVRAYFRAALGEQVPVVNSAIVTGR